MATAPAKNTYSQREMPVIFQRNYAKSLSRRSASPGKIPHDKAEENHSAARARRRAARSESFTRLVSVGSFLPKTETLT